MRMELSLDDYIEVCLNVQEDLGKLTGPYQRAVYDYWLEAPRAGDLPPVSAIDPLCLPPGCLPHVLVMEHDVATGRFRSRLIGTHVVDVTGMDFKDRYMDEFDAMEMALRRFRWAVQNRKPYWLTAPLLFATRNFARYNLLCLPFAGVDAQVTRLLFVFAFE